MAGAGPRFEPKTGPIGLDFDNTLIAYGQVFCRAAQERGLIPEGFTGTKRAVREAIRKRRDGEFSWQLLQGHVYGHRIDEATLADGVGRFLDRCRREGVRLCIVSHKTECSPFDPSRVKLRSVALDWMERHQFFAADGFALDRDAVHFTATRAEKLARIAALGCRLFIDDLEEVLSDPGFPADVGRVLFAEPLPVRPLAYKVLPSWRQIEREVFGDDP
jgi:hypothetical protein